MNSALLKALPVSFNAAHLRAWLALGALCMFSLAASAQGATTGEAVDTRPVVVVKTTKGDIVLELDRDLAPATVANFLSYADEDFYTGTLFHRVIDGFMIQGGGFTEDYQRKQTKPAINNEAYNGLTNRRYSVAMARTNDPHSATSQFFINTADNNNLDHTDTTQRGWGYTVFGQVIDGKEVVDAISQTRTGAGGPFSRDAPLEPIVILGVEQMSSASDDDDSALSTDSTPASAAALPKADNAEGTAADSADFD